MTQRLSRQRRKTPTSFMTTSSLSTYSSSSDIKDTHQKKRAFDSRKSSLQWKSSLLLPLHESESWEVVLQETILKCILHTTECITEESRFVSRELPLSHFIRISFFLLPLSWLMSITLHYSSLFLPSRHFYHQLLACQKDIFIPSSQETKNDKTSNKQLSIRRSSDSDDSFKENDEEVDVLQIPSESPSHEKTLTFKSFPLNWTHIWSCLNSRRRPWWCHER